MILAPAITPYQPSSSNPLSAKQRYTTLAQPDISVITVFEHQRLTPQDFSQAADFEWLLAQEFDVFSLKRQRGQWQLKVGHYIGIILLPSGTILEILPKSTTDDAHSNSKSQDIALTRQWVQRMLSDLFTKESSRVPHHKNLGQISQNLMPLPALPIPSLPLSQWLTNQFLQLLLDYKPTQHYQAHIQNQSSLQGKLLIKEQLRRNSTQPHKFISEVSCLNQDMLSNRLIKSALLLLQPLSAKLSPAKSALAKHLLAWQAVIALSPYELRQLDTLYLSAKRQLDRQPIMRQQLQVAQQLLQWAYWLLQRQQMSLQTGSSLSAHSIGSQNSATTACPPRLCILFNMNQAFEQWACLCIAQSFRQLDDKYLTFEQSQHNWLRDKWGQSCLSIRPDLLIAHSSADSLVKNEKHYSHVIDIKWKSLAHANAISASDAYQLTSYAQAYQVSQVWLVYPVTDPKRQPTILRQYGLNKRLDHAELWLMPFNVLNASLNHETLTS